MAETGPKGPDRSKETVDTTTTAPESTEAKVKSLEEQFRKIVDNLDHDEPKERAKARGELKDLIQKNINIPGVKEAIGTLVAPLNKEVAKLVTKIMEGVEAAHETIEGIEKLDKYIGAFKEFIEEYSKLPDKEIQDLCKEAGGIFARADGMTPEKRFMEQGSIRGDIGKIGSSIEMRRDNIESVHWQLKSKFHLTLKLKLERIKGDKEKMKKAGKAVEKGDELLMQFDEMTEKYFEDVKLKETGGSEDIFKKLMTWSTDAKNTFHEIGYEKNPGEFTITYRGMSAGEGGRWLTKEQKMEAKAEAEKKAKEEIKLPEELKGMDLKAMKTHLRTKVSALLFGLQNILKDFKTSKLGKKLKKIIKNIGAQEKKEDCYEAFTKGLSEIKRINEENKSSADTLYGEGKEYALKLITHFLEKGTVEPLLEEIKKEIKKDMELPSEFKGMSLEKVNSHFKSQLDQFAGLVAKMTTKLDTNRDVAFKSCGLISAILVKAKNRIDDSIKPEQSIRRIRETVRIIKSDVLVIRIEHTVGGKKEEMRAGVAIFGDKYRETWNMLTQLAKTGRFRMPPKPAKPKEASKKPKKPESTKKPRKPEDHKEAEKSRKEVDELMKKIKDIPEEKIDEEKAKELLGEIEKVNDEIHRRLDEKQISWKTYYELATPIDEALKKFDGIAYPERKKTTDSLLAFGKKIGKDEHWVNSTFDVQGDGKIRVYGNLDLSETAIGSLPDNMTVAGDLNLEGTDIKTLPKNLVTMGDLKLDGCNELTSIPEGLEVSGSLSLDGCDSITALPLVKVNRIISLIGCKNLTSLPEGLEIGSALSLNNCSSLTSLPNNMTINGDISLDGCSGLKTLPDDFKVGGMVTISKDQKELKAALALLKDAGKIKGDIYIDNVIYKPDKGTIRVMKARVIVKEKKQQKQNLKKLQKKNL